MPSWMPKGLMQRAQSTNCVAESGAPDTDPSPPGSADNCYLPDFSTTSSVVSLVFISALVAVILALASDTTLHGFFVHLANTSLLMLWMVLTSAAMITLVRPVLAQRTVVAATVFSVGLVLANIALLSELVFQFGRWLGPDAGDLLWTFPANHWEFLARNLMIGVLVSVAVLRYFYVTHQWVTNMRREAESRVTALQARIRPHFLFNSMNTIAALTRTNPEAAEQAVEDLADLFRASLNNPGAAITLEQELEIARVYQRMEEQRLGERLRVDWHVDRLPLDARIPGLTIQPLLENAIYHGIEPLADGGVVSIVGEESNDMITIRVSNPLAAQQTTRSSSGHRLALDNIRQRLQLAYGERARFEIDKAADHFEVLVGFPLAPGGA